MIIKIRAFLNDLFSSLVRDVPSDSARCEYICDKLECPPGIFEQCKKRKDYERWKRDD